jgi:hypothetical protein
MAFGPGGNLYFQDNGIDGEGDGREPLSVDELNVIVAGDLGVTVPPWRRPGRHVFRKSRRRPS